MSLENHLKRFILIFWASWFTIACASNITDFFNALNWTAITFKSGNYFFVKSVMSLYSVPTNLINLCFVIIILLEASCAILFFRAVFDFKNSKKMLHAFLMSMGLWGLFMLMDELFIAYGFEGTHARLLILEFVSLLGIKLI